MTVVNSILYGADDMVGRFVTSRLRAGPLPGFELPRFFVGLGIVKKGIFVGGVIFHNQHTFNDRPVWIEVGIACDHPSWATKQTIRQIFKYPFVQLGCATLLSSIRKSNHRSRKLCEGLGFKLTGKIPHGHDGREDILGYAMTRKQCHWLEERENAKE